MEGHGPYDNQGLICPTTSNLRGTHYALQVSGTGIVPLGQYIVVRESELFCQEGCLIEWNSESFAARETNMQRKSAKDKLSHSQFQVHATPTQFKLLRTIRVACILRSVRCSPHAPWHDSFTKIGLPLPLWLQKHIWRVGERALLKACYIT